MTVCSWASCAGYVRVCQAICRAGSLQLHKTHISPINLSPGRADPELAWCVTGAGHCAGSVSAWLQFVTLDHTPILGTVFIRLRGLQLMWIQTPRQTNRHVLTHCHFNFSKAQYAILFNKLQTITNYVTSIGYLWNLCLFKGFLNVWCWNHSRECSKEADVIWLYLAFSIGCIVRLGFVFIAPHWQ